jgi:hypothetical protein
VFDFVFSDVVNQGTSEKLTTAIPNETRFTMKALLLIIAPIIFMPEITLSMGIVPVPQEEETREAVKPTISSSTKPFKTSFISLKRGHSIAPSFITFGDEGELEVQTPGENFLKTKGSFTKDGLLFNASFEANLLRQKKNYLYTFTLKGISLFENYIAGVLVLSEYIRETDQTQEVRFLFLGTPEAEKAPKDEGKGLFPF